MQHFDHGYAVTSHSSQGLTEDRVLVNMDTNTFSELLNPRFA
jgi:ATP-dependent exoDNAse (exonuclease V) alpha subunit